MFVLDSTLQRDTLPIGDLPLCRLLLSNDANYPWFILVPRCEGVSEVFQLSAAHAHQLWSETIQVAEALKAAFVTHKVNIATLGNVVNQLHMHVIVRRRDDAAWPAPVWGRHPSVPYGTDQVGRIREQLRPLLQNCVFEEGI